MLKRLVIVGGAVLSASAWAGYVAGRNLFRSWGINAAEAARPLPGDDIVPEPTGTDTRGIDIAAPPEKVWPWLVQMGYGRAGFYSYDAVDMNRPSLQRIDPALQTLAVGDILPTFPGGGFEVKVLEPERALVVFVDKALIEAQVAKARTESAPTEANLKVTGMYLDKAMAGDFSASWAFVLEPTETGTRLIERARVRMDMPPQMSDMSGRVARAMFGFGVFMMIRRQMLGIRARAEGRPDRVFPFMPAPLEMPGPTPAAV